MPSVIEQSGLVGENMPDHRHNGFDVSRVYFDDLVDRKIQVNHTIVGTAAATAANYGVFFIAPFPCYVSSFREVHQTLGTDGGAVTLQLEKLTSGQAPDSGTALLSTALSLKTTINVVQSGVIVPLNTSYNLATGDRLCLKDAGTLTAVANVTVSVELVLI